MIPGARSWANVANVVGDSAEQLGPSVLPRVLFIMFSGRMPVLNFFHTGAQPEAITNEPEFWTYFRPRPADNPEPSEKAHWERVKAHWQLRMAHPELKSGSLILKGIAADDAAVFAFLREKDGHLSIVALNFRQTPVECKLSIDWALAGVKPPSGDISPRDLLRDSQLPATNPQQLEIGYSIEIPARDGRVVKLS